ncbi:sphingosine kinase [Streptomyces albidoflavus]|uniref:YegS/Rv2252/BmrU family lipid kinase n=1 Tax=Streptomyces albidoflavus TaxID=1886 RepID=UPI000BAE4F22|nr:YegS/Rv2252/BmrU family lipid kinase [Streptomyces albidoflavus]PAX87350.1 sphingosine kinase [Streptomyces albidoflavus]PAX88017.1 sphingosine kinase [Streptomyces albidoflavus]PBO15155.1 sphingosine kinase [Streptomyces albidoflavus]PBO24292.1 sphingosine kinase [Streptomyces albidoflavus]PBO31670.1 sphingosine kinase [Streptomyces albidoflavus]
MTSEIILFVNPTAGRGRGARAALPASRVLRDVGYRVRTVLGTDADDAAGRLREALTSRPAAVLAVGGDGLAGLALQALAGTGTPLGLVAVGTGNDFARTLGLPVRDPEAAARFAVRTLEGPGPRPLDLGQVGDRWFGTVLAAGFDSRVNDRGNRMRLPAGRFKYDLAILAELAAFRPVPFKLALDDGPVLDLDATLVAVGNGTSYGGGLRMCDGARLDDGLFDVVVVGEVSRAELVRVFPKVYKGTHLSHPAVTVHRARSVTVEAPDITGYADGEPLGALPLTARCVPGAVRMLAP